MGRNLQDFMALDPSHKAEHFHLGQGTEGGATAKRLAKWPGMILDTLRLQEMRTFALSSKSNQTVTELQRDVLLKSLHTQWPNICSIRTDLHCQSPTFAFAAGCFYFFVAASHLSLFQNRSLNQFFSRSTKHETIIETARLIAISLQRTSGCWFSIKAERPLPSRHVITVTWSRNNVMPEPPPPQGPARGLSGGSCTTIQTWLHMAVPTSSRSA